MADSFYLFFTELRFEINNKEKDDYLKKGKQKNETNEIGATLFHLKLYVLCSLAVLYPVDKVLYVVASNG